jgi:DNA ligase (NAD+)
MADNLTDLSVDALAERLEAYNAAYRRGEPLITDAEYDALVERLSALAPAHPFLKAVEPEVFPAKRQIRHPAPMLSTEKAYSLRDLKMFLARVQKKADELGIQDPTFKVTPKLDGLAGRDDGTVLASRGDGESGFDITSAIEKGVIIEGGRGRGLGELVILKSYFEGRLAGAFVHPRNTVVGIVAADTVTEAAQQALEDGAVRFVPYADVEAWTGSGQDLVAGIEDIYADLIEIDYPTDGLVIEAIDPSLREALGATAHHYRWQIAFKRRGETAVTTVEGVTWQIGRTGNLTPVMEVAPVSLSGATIRRVTAHNAERLIKDRIGPGAQIEIIRSGEVIPKIEKVFKPSDQVELPERCPSCQTLLQREGPFLRCPNSEGCRDQIVQRIRHWFHTIGNADWFGIKTVERLVDTSRDTLAKVYDLRIEDFEAAGFGPVQSANLLQALQISRSQPMADWRFLAAFGLPHLGTGDSRRLLRAIPLELVLDAEAEQIARIYGFADLTSRAIADEIKIRADEIRAMLQRGFNLERTPPVAVDFLVSLAVFEDLVQNQAAKKNKESLEWRRNAAAMILAHWRLGQLAAVTAEDLAWADGDFEGFELGISACQTIASRLAGHTATLARAEALPLDWVYPADREAEASASDLASKRVVFSGKMVQGSREAMQADARRRGMIVQEAVSRQTDLLICGQKVGAAKLNKAQALGVTVIDEDQYWELVGANAHGRT